MDAMVSARVPVELKDQVNEGLRAIGSSPTELINRAYEFFLDTRRLPGDSAPAKAGQRELDQTQIDELLRSIEATTHTVPEAYFQSLNYDDLLEKSLRESYEALA